MKNEPLAQLLARESDAGVIVVKWPKDVRIPGAGSGTYGPYVVFEGTAHGEKERALRPEEVDAYADRRQDFLNIHDEWLAVGRNDGRPFLSLAKVFGDDRLGFEAATRRARHRGQSTFYDAGREQYVPVGTSFDDYVDEESEEV